MKLEFDFKKTDVEALLTRRKYLFLGAVMVILGIGILIFGTVPQVTNLITLITTSNTEKVAVKGLQNKVTALKQVSYMSEFSKSDKLNLALPSEKPLLQLISGVNSV